MTICLGVLKTITAYLMLKLSRVYEYEATIACLKTVGGTQNIYQ